MDSQDLSKLGTKPATVVETAISSEKLPIDTINHAVSIFNNEVIRNSWLSGASAS
jgi:hypothetical protein